MASTACSLVKRASVGVGVVAGLVHVAAATAGGVVMGLTLGLLGLVLSGAIPLAPLVVVAVVFAGWDMVRGQMRYVQPPGGVPAAWRRWHPFGYMAAYGGVLGMGLFTPFTAAAMIGLTALLIAAGDPMFGAVVFALYGFARGVAAMLAGAIALRAGLPRVTQTLQVAKSSWRPALGILTAFAAIASL